MFAFVLGFLSELARETGDWLDRLLPAPRARRSLRSWRRRRPFWAALWVIGPKGVFAVQADTAVAHDLRSTAYSANGGTLT
ncbi:hypothetical protein AB0L81_42175, partial [Streptomyces sp. NPDC052127]